MLTPATAIPPTDTAMPPITATMPAPSETLTPTAIPVTPTSEAVQIAEYLAATENSFPIKLFDGLGEFFGTLDFGNIIFVNEKSPDGGKIGGYCIIRDGGVNFIAPCFLETDKFVYTPLGWGLSIKPTTPGNWNSDDLAIVALMKNVTDQLKVTGKSSRIRALIGDNPGSVYKGANIPYVDIFSTSNWDEAVVEFMQDGNYKKLPVKTVGGVTGYLLPAIRISVTDSVTSTP